ncbi:EAL domain-containing protein [Neptunicella marina]|uniref:cyclic-guanylate-specific phosphodiesterase n=1 Tax=Neptunicella marina TaxID=2125989 RepID=A0A8J6IJE6_9ALTE|nr:EAL domain-containing protein [Neptunicella marina]MBC3764350.1 EAL domain-containing protein [Neptunicella marina]
MKSGQEKVDKHIKALIIEDMEDDAIILIDYLERFDYSLNWVRVDTPEQLKTKLHEDWDIIFSDFTMPAFSGLDALKIVRQCTREIPFIFVSGSMGEDHAVDAIRNGAQDFIIKGQFRRLLPSLERELQERERTQKHRLSEEMVQKLTAAIEQTTDSVIITDADFVVEYVNHAFEAHNKSHNSNLIGQCFFNWYEKHSEDNISDVKKLLQQGYTYQGYLKRTDQDGSQSTEELVISPLKNSKGQPDHFVCTSRDITARLRSEESTRRLSSILEASPDIVVTMSPQCEFDYINAAAKHILTDDEGIRLNHLVDLFSPTNAHSMVASMQSVVEEFGVWTGETQIITANKESLPVSAVMLSHTNNNGEIQYYSLIARDISERKYFENELQHHSTHDALTGLPNRFFLLSNAKMMLDKNNHFNKYGAVFSLNIDNFRRINDSLGHAEGDHLLIQIANRLSAQLKPSDLISRQSGDEFTILLSDLNKPEEAHKVVKRLKDAFKQPLNTLEHEFFITFRVGIAIYPNDSKDIEDLLVCADTALHQTKSLGVGHYCFYETNMNARSHEILKLEADLQRALDNDEFLLYYQPQIDLHSQQIVGVEALIRWQHPHFGLVSPADFVELLESSGLIVPVGEWVVRQACTLHQQFRSMGYDHVRMSVNVSTVQFAEKDFLVRVQRALQELQMPAHMLELEITENLMMKNPKKTTTILNALRAMGVRSAIDDFGTGYSSMSYLKLFPVDTLKIDRAFIRDITSDSRDEAIVEASVSLAQKMGLQTVAEGVETQQQLNSLQKLGCSHVQGFFFSKPVDETTIKNLLKRGIHY